MSEFESAAARAKTLKSLSNDELLELYKFYKQATVGDCNTSRPGMFSPVDRAKWDAWDSVKGASKEDAEKAYIELVAKLSS